MDLIIGHLRQVNGSYMVNESFLHNYHSVGDDFLQSKAFKQEYGVNHAQAQYDKGYLYGILQSVTRNGGAKKKHVLRYKHTTDGFLTWKDLVHDCDHDGSTTLHMEKLTMLVHEPYSSKFPGGLINFVDWFQITMEELGSYKSMYSSDNAKLSTLILALRRSSSCIPHLDHIQSKNLDFDHACAYVRMYREESIRK